MADPKIPDFALQQEEERKKNLQPEAPQSRLDRFKSGALDLFQSMGQQQAAVVESQTAGGRLGQAAESYITDVNAPSFNDALLATGVQSTAQQPTIAPAPVLVETIDPNSAFNSPLATAPSQQDTRDFSLPQSSDAENPFDPLPAKFTGYDLGQQGLYNAVKAGEAADAAEALEAIKPLSPQANFLEWQKGGKEMNDQQRAEANALAASMGTTFNPQTGYSRQPFLDAQGQQAATPQSLSDFMAYRDAPQDATIQVQDAQGRFRRQAAPVAGETPEQNLARTNAILLEQADFNQASADREQRIANRPDFGTAYSNQELRDMGDPSGGVISGESGGDKPDYRAIARAKGYKGSAVNAQAKVLEAEAAEKDLTPEEQRLQELRIQQLKQDIAKGNKPDLTPEEQRLQELRIQQLEQTITKGDKPDRTPEQIEAAELQNARLRQIIDQANKPDATSSEKKAGDRAKGVRDGIITQAQADEAAKRELIGKPPLGYDTWAQAEAAQGQDLDGDGKVATEADAKRARLEELRKKAGK